MAITIDIYNRALQEIGGKRIAAITDDSVGARACAACADPVRLALLRDYTWSFSIKRAQLAANATAPAFGPANAYPLPSDFVRLAPPDASDNLNSLDWQIEGNEIVTDDDPPLNIRYVADVTDPNRMDAIFREAYALSMADAMCEQITQSNQKKAAIEAKMDKVIERARRAGAIEKPVQVPPEDIWMTARV